MARHFVCIDKLDVSVRPQIPALVDHQGRTLERQKPAIWARFYRGAPYWALQQVGDRFKWDRVPPHTTPQQWVAWFDSAEAQKQFGWSDEERELAEDAVAGRPGVIEVFVPRVVEPYPNYLKKRKVAGKRTLDHVLHDILSAVDSAGISPQSIIDYEEDHRDDLSDRIIEAMQILQAQRSEPEEELIEA